MPRAERLEILRRIQARRRSKVICYLTADRPSRVAAAGLSIQLSSEAQVWISEHLRRIGQVRQIDLFLYTRGGETDSVWPLVNQIREHCRKFCVLVPFRAHSAGTLICLGADEILMSRFGELSPIDPTTGNPFNPLDELAPGRRKGISVEDVTAYMALAKDEKKLGVRGETHLLEVFKKLVDNVHPLALGNVNRSHTQIRMLAKNLLALGAKKFNKAKVEAIVDTLTEKLYSHLHAICRRDAASLLGSMVSTSDRKLDADILSLFAEFSSVMRLKERFNVMEFMGAGLQANLDLIGGFIESESLSHIFSAQNRITLRSQLPPGMNLQLQAGQDGQIAPAPLIPGLPTEINVEIIREGWQNNEKGV